MCLAEKQCVSVLQCQEACQWFYEGGDTLRCVFVYLQLRHLHTHTHTCACTHTNACTRSVCTDRGQCCYIREEFDVFSVLVREFRTFPQLVLPRRADLPWWEVPFPTIPSMLSDTSEARRSKHVETLFTLLSEFSLAPSLIPDLLQNQQHKESLTALQEIPSPRFTS